LQRLYPGFETYNEHEEDRLEHLQIAKSRGKGAPKKKRTAAGETGIFAQPVMAAVAVVERMVILTGLTQRARSSTARRGNSGFTALHETGFCWEEFGDTGKCTISPHEYPSWERRLLVFACISHGFPDTHLRQRSIAAPHSFWDLVLPLFLPRRYHNFQGLLSCDQRRASPNTMLRRYSTLD
jgi:hypothetical protein